MNGPTYWHESNKIRTIYRPCEDVGRGPFKLYRIEAPAPKENVVISKHALNRHLDWGTTNHRGVYHILKNDADLAEMPLACSLRVLWRNKRLLDELTAVTYGAKICSFCFHVSFSLDPYNIENHGAHVLYWHLRTAEARHRENNTPKERQALPMPDFLRAVR